MGMKNREIIGGYGLTLSEVKDYIRVDNTDEDALISVLISSSYEQVCAETNRDFLHAKYTMNVVSSSGDIYLTGQDATDVSQGDVKYVDGVTFTYISDTYTGPVEYTVASGSTDLPANVKVASMMLVSSWYDNRQFTSTTRANKLDFTVEALLSPYKIVTPSFDVAHQTY